MFILFSFIFQKPAGQRHILQVGPMWVWRLGFSPWARSLSHLSKSNIHIFKFCSVFIFPPFHLADVSLSVLLRHLGNLCCLFCLHCLGSLSAVLRLKASHWCPVWNLTVLFRFSPCLFSFLSHVFSFISLSDSSSFFFLTVCVLYTQGIETKQWREVSVCAHTHKGGLCII